MRTDPDQPHSPNDSLPTRWVTVPLGFFVGGLATALMAAALAIVFTIGPFSRLLGFDEFDALMIIGLPVISLPGGAIGGTVFGSLRHCNLRYLYSILAAFMIAGFYFLLGVSQNELSKKDAAQWVSVTTVSVFMLVSAAFGVWTVSKVVGLLFDAKPAVLQGNDPLK